MHFFRLTLLLFLLSACRAGRKLPVQAGKSAETAREAALQSEYQNWPTPWWSAKAKVTFRSEGNSIPVNVNIRAEEGKALWFSATAFGLLEVARGRLDGDSLRVLDKVNNRCIRTAMAGFGSFLPLKTDIRQLQHFLMGRVFWDSLMRVQSKNMLDTLQLSGNQGDIAFRARLLGKYRLLQADADIQSGGQIRLQNSEFRDVSGFPVSFRKELSSKLPAGDKITEGGLKMEFTRFEFLNAAPEMEFSLPDDCSPMQLK
jgi:hypothetical protein